MKIKLKEDERIDDLEYKGLQIIQNKNWFCFGMDSVLLSNFAKNEKPGSYILDLGTGTGIISILLSEKIKDSKIKAIEIQGVVAEMARRSMELNGISNRVEVINEDIKNIDALFGRGKFDVVVTNPPYKKSDTGLVNENSVKMISRHEITASLEDFIRVASEQLKDKGCLYMVNIPERLADIIEFCRRYRLEPKSIRFVHPSVYKKPNLILVKAVKNAGRFLKIEEPLYVYNLDGTYTDEIYEIYEKEK